MEKISKTEGSLDLKLRVVMIKIIEGTMRDEVERLKNSKSVNYKKDIRSLECLSSSAEEET